MQQDREISAEGPYQLKTGPWESHIRVTAPDMEGAVISHHHPHHLTPKHWISDGVRKLVILPFLVV
jgi:hypothetical protein